MYDIVDFALFLFYLVSAFIVSQILCSVPQAPALGVGQVMTINLLPSDDAFGVVRFDQSSVAVIIAEAPSSTVTVSRPTSDRKSEVPFCKLL